MTESNLFSISFENVVCCEELCDELELEDDDDEEEEEELEDFFDEDELLCKVFDVLSSFFSSVIGDFFLLEESFDFALVLKIKSIVYTKFTKILFGH